MNLVLSGPIDPNLLQLAVALAGPREVVRLHDRAQRLVGADDSEATRQEIDRICEIARVDHAFVPEGLRFSDFKLLAMDMDSTLITIECIDEIADFVGKKAEVAAITAATMRGEIPDFAESLRRRVALLAGLQVSSLTDVYNQRLQLNAGAKDLIGEARRQSIYTLLLSGGFTFFADQLKEILGLSEAKANQLETYQGLLTGKLIEPIFGSDEKAKKVASVATSLNCDRAHILVVGDGANDIIMMKSVIHSVAFHAKPMVQHSAAYLISYGGLDVILDYFSRHNNERPILC